MCVCVCTRHSAVSAPTDISSDRFYFLNVICRPLKFDQLVSSIDKSTCVRTYDKKWTKPFQFLTMSVGNILIILHVRILNLIALFLLLIDFGFSFRLILLCWSTVPFDCVNFVYAKFIVFFCCTWIILDRMNNRIPNTKNSLTSMWINGALQESEGRNMNILYSIELLWCLNSQRLFLLSCLIKISRAHWFIVYCSHIQLTYAFIYILYYMRLNVEQWL